MTTERSRLTDYDIERFLQARSADPDAALWSDIVTAAGAASQRSGPWARWTARRRFASLVLAAAVLILMAGAIGLGISLIRPVPPTPSPAEALSFDRQFTYALPANLGLDLDEASGGIYRFDGTDRGVAVVAFRPGTAIYECPPGGRPEGYSTSESAVISGTPTEVIENLRVIGGVGIGAQSSITWDGRPALSADIDPLRHVCEAPHIHLPELPLRRGALPLDVPARLILADVDGLVVGVQIWSEDAADLDEWIATAAGFVETIHFFARAARFDTPFDYAIPAASGLRLEVAASAVYRFEATNRGVVVFAVRSDAQAHSCAPRTNVIGTPEQVMENLRRLSSSVGAGATTTLASYPAVFARIDPSTAECYFDIHLVPGLSSATKVVAFDRPSRLILADVNGVVVGVLVWTEQPDELDAWLPTAMEFVETIEFLDP